MSNTQPISFCSPLPNGHLPSCPLVRKINVSPSPQVETSESSLFLFWLPTLSILQIQNLFIKPFEINRMQIQKKVLLFLNHCFKSIVKIWPSLNDIWREDSILPELPVSPLVRFLLFQNSPSPVFILTGQSLLISPSPGKLSPQIPARWIKPFIRVSWLTRNLGSSAMINGRVAE